MCSAGSGRRGCARPVGGALPASAPRAAGCAAGPQVGSRGGGARAGGEGAETIDLGEDRRDLARAARHLVDLHAPAADAVDYWMVGPFHQVAILDPRLRVSGFGEWREAVGTFHYGATLDVLRGREEPARSTRFPVRYPDAGSTMPLLRSRRQMSVSAISFSKQKSRQAWAASVA